MEVQNNGGVQGDAPQEQSDGGEDMQGQAGGMAAMATQYNACSCNQMKLMLNLPPIHRCNCAVANVGNNDADQMQKVRTANGGRPRVFCGPLIPGPQGTSLEPN